MTVGARDILAVLMMALMLNGCAALSVTSDELEHIRGVAERVVPWNTPVEVATRDKGPGKAALSIRVQLIPGDKSARPATAIPAALGSSQALTAYAEQRAAEVYREVLSNVEVPDVSGVNVEIQHGVEQFIGTREQSRVVSVTIYETHIPLAKVRAKNWPTMSNEAIKSLWTVETDLIPSLGFE